MNPTIEENIKEKLKGRKNAHFMLVDGMSKLMTHEVEECGSSVFNVSGIKWTLEINPCRKEARDYLGLFLTISDVKSLPSNWEVRCGYKLSVVSQTKHVDDKCGGTHVMCYKDTAKSWGQFKFISHKELERYIVNDKAVFCAEITEVKPKFPVTCIDRTMGTANRLKVMDVPREKSRFTWKITQFSSFNGVEHSSYEFSVGPRRWRLEMFPKGNNTGKENSLSLYLKATDYVTNNAPKEVTLAVFKLKVLDQFKRNHYEIRTEDMFGYDVSKGRDKFLPLKELHDPKRGLLVNDEIYISVEFLLVGSIEYL